MAVKKTKFEDDWKIWIWSNIASGKPKDGIFRILIDNDFEYDAIKAELNYEPSISIDQIENPLLAKKLGPSKPIERHSSQAQPKNSPFYFPNARRIQTELAELYVIDNFLSESECQQLIQLIKGELVPSTITNRKEIDASFRTSKTCNLSALNDPFVQDIDQRLCQYLGINPSYSENIQGQHYEVGNEFKAHTDYFEADELETFGAVQGQRTWTFMLYLNQTSKGGETKFPKLNQSFRPKAGQAILWNSLDQAGNPNHNTLHQAMIVEAGEKTIITKWFRERGQGKCYTKSANEKIPAITAKGFGRSKMPAPLFQKVSTYFQNNSASAEREIVKGFIAGEHGQASDLIELPTPLKTEIHESLKPMLEEWSGIQLTPTYIYGIRRYNRGAHLKCHRDRLDTHIISAILNIAQDVDEDWALEIEDHYCRRHQIILAPGEMIFYEGARLLHGRPLPFKGEFYANAFVHYKPL